MGEIIIRNAVQRRPGYLYYIDGQGNLCEAKMVTRKKRKKEYSELLKDFHI